MGYDHFALISVSSEPSIKKLNQIRKACGELREINDECLFGEVHHLTSGSFGEYWIEQFDDFMLKLYEETNVKKFDLYVCEFDGESLVKYEYVKGIKKNNIPIEIIVNDYNVTCYWDMRSLVIKRNITIFYNKNYRYEYTD